MRLWHKDLIDYLPKQQLVSQWRECCCIAKSIAENGTPNHILVNKIMEYPIEEFYTYGLYVYMAMQSHGYNCDWKCFNKYFNEINVSNNVLFKNWHNHRYLTQCYYNLQEKYDCGGIPKKEWKILMNRYYKLMDY